MTQAGRRVLVLNASYEPIHICTVRRALVLVWKGAAHLEEDAGRGVRSPSATLAEPSVIRLTEYRRMPQSRGALSRGALSHHALSQRAPSRRHILARDQHTCQYCGASPPPSTLTLDHVQPRSRGGATSWENLVAACRPCNTRKGARTPEEARMPLRRPPRGCLGPQLLRSLAEGEQHWRKYVFA